MIGGMTKTPTMSVRHEYKRDFVGGAGIVAKHISSAGASVTFSTLLGDDELGKFAQDDLARAGVNCLPIIDSSRPTTNKNAVIAGDYRLLKIDTLDNRTISDKALAKLIRQIKSSEADIVVFSDFRHGIFNKQTIQQLIRAIPKNAYRVADSQVASRWGNITDFQGFDLITPNEREARFALGDQDSVVRPLGADLYQKAGCKTLILKLGKRGIMMFRDRPDDDPRTFIAIDSFARNVVDAVGAGDALLAYAALSLATDSKKEALGSVLGSMAAGIACESDGNQTVSPEKIRLRLREIERELCFSPELEEV
jgi:rfaE bifunctional protein kinase chain/domain